MSIFPPEYSSKLPCVNNNIIIMYKSYICNMQPLTALSLQAAGGERKMESRLQVLDRLDSSRASACASIISNVKKKIYIGCIYFHTWANYGHGLIMSSSFLGLY